MGLGLSNMKGIILCLTKKTTWDEFSVKKKVKVENGQGVVSMEGVALV